MKTANIPKTNQQFPIGKIVCLARNYAEHARELGNETPAAPVLFMKPATSVIGDGEAVRIPDYSQECHYEVELAVLIGKTARAVSADQAMEHVAGYATAIDMTLRDVQNALKAKGLPWRSPRVLTPPVPCLILCRPQPFPTRITSPCGSR